MAKRTTSNARNAKPNSSNASDGTPTPSLVPNEMLWPMVAAGFSSLLILSFLIPADSIGVYQGGSLPGVLGWMLLAMSAVAAGFITNLRVQASRFEIACVLLGLTWLIVESLWVSHGSNRRMLWNGFWQLMAIASCYYIARGLMQVDRMRSAVMLLLFVGCTALALDGLGQVMITMPASRAAYQKDPELVLRENKIDAPAGSPKRRVFEDRLNSPEPFATFSLANSLGTMLCLGSILTIQGLIRAVVVLRSAPLSPSGGRGSSADRPRSVWRLWAVTSLSIALLVQLACLLLTRSRTAYLSFILALGIWGLLEILRGRSKDFGRGSWSLIGIAIAIVIAGLVGMVAIDNRIATEAVKSLGYRMEYWQATVAMIQDHTLIGIGLGNFQSVYPRYKLIEASETIADPHNWVLDVAVTLSLPIAIGIVAWVFYTLARSLWICFRNDQVNTNQVEGTFSDQLVRWFLVGAIVGGGFCFGISILAGQLSWTTIVSWIISIPIGFCIGKTRLFDTHSLPNQISACVAVLICMLFSGGWQCPGIAMPLVVLMAGLNVVGRSSPIDGSRPLKLSNPRWAFAMVLLTLGGGIIFIAQTWRPVTQSWQSTEELQNAISAQELMRLAKQAASADPMDPEKQVMLGQLEANEAINAGVSNFDTLASSAIKRLSLISDNNHATCQVAGNICLELAAGAVRLGVDNEIYLKKAFEFYVEAALRYPSSIELQMQCAASAATLNDWAEVESRLRKSEELDKRIPHLDKKLNVQLVWLPVPIPGFDYTVSSQEQIGFVRAEPLAAWLRSKLEAK